MIELDWEVFCLIRKASQAAFFRDEITYAEYIRIDFWAGNLIDSGYFKGKAHD